MLKTLAETINFLDQVTIVISAVSMLFSFLVWLKIRKQIAIDSQRIQIKIVVPGTGISFRLWSQPERRHLTRAEVLGLIGLIPRNCPENFKIAFLNTPQFFYNLAQVQDNNETTLRIECTKQELQQFDLEKIKSQSECTGL